MNHSARYYHKCTEVLIRSAHCYCKILMKFEISRQFFFRKILKYQFILIRSVGAEFFDAGGRGGG
jgi:hypothetical protein